MAREDVIVAIEKELRALRRQPGPLDESKLSSARMIARGFGNDDHTVALHRLLDLFDEYRHDAEIQAAFATMDDTGSGSVLGHLSSYAALRGKDQRTIRRWSDAGIHKLALLILGSAPWLQPRARQILTVRGDRVMIGLDLRIPPGLRVEMPTLELDGQILEIRMDRIEVKADAQRVAGGLEPLLGLADLPSELRLSWHGEKLPAFDAITHGTSDVYFKTRLAFVSMRTSMRKSTGTAHE